MVLLMNNLHEKSITESQDRQNFDSTSTICNLHLCYNFAPVLHGKCTCFQPVKSMLFFYMYYQHDVAGAQNIFPNYQRRGG